MKITLKELKQLIKEAVEEQTAGVTTGFGAPFNPLANTSMNQLASFAFTVEATDRNEQLEQQISARGNEAAQDIDQILAIVLRPYVMATPSKPIPRRLTQTDLNRGTVHILPNVNIDAARFQQQGVLADIEQQIAAAIGSTLGVLYTQVEIFHVMTRRGIGAGGALTVVPPGTTRTDYMRENKANRKTTKKF